MRDSRQRRPAFPARAATVDGRTPPPATAGPAPRPGGRRADALAAARAPGPRAALAGDGVHLERALGAVDRRLRALEARLRAARACVLRGEAHDDWDLEVRSGILGVSRLVMESKITPAPSSSSGCAGGPRFQRVPILALGFAALAGPRRKPTSGRGRVARPRRRVADVAQRRTVHGRHGHDQTDHRAAEQGGW